MTTGNSYFSKSILTAIMVVIYASIASAASRPTVWFAPDGETPDFIELFTKPQLWAKARSQIDVFKFGPNRIDSSTRPKPNSLADLVNAAAFRRLREWGIRIAIEAPAIKEWDCTGIQAAKLTSKYVNNLIQASGSVSFIAMDEPLASGVGRCHLTVEQIAANTAAYRMNILSDKGLRSSVSPIAIGDIEAYPSYGVNLLETWVRALVENGFKPSFFHLDVDINDVDLHPNIDVVGDLRELAKFFRAEEIPFGIIFWSGHDPESSDQAYYNHTLNWVKRVRAAIGKPEQLVFQSWVLRSSSYACSGTTKCNAKNPRCTPDDPSYCGMHSVPVNLPENDIHVFSHTRLIDEALKVLDGR